MNAALMQEAERIADELLDEREKRRRRNRERRAKLREQYPPKAVYWDGKQCLKHPGAARYRSSSSCVPCAIERTNEWRKQRKEKRK